MFKKQNARYVVVRRNKNEKYLPRSLDWRYNPAIVPNTVDIIHKIVIMLNPWTKDVDRFSRNALCLN